MDRDLWPPETCKGQISFEDSRVGGLKCQVGLPSLPLSSGRRGIQLTTVTRPIFPKAANPAGKGALKGVPLSPCDFLWEQPSLRLASSYYILSLPSCFFPLSTFCPLLLSPHSDFPQLMLLLFTSLHCHSPSKIICKTGALVQLHCHKLSHSQPLCFPFRHAHSIVDTFPFPPSHLFLTFSFSFSSVFAQKVFSMGQDYYCVYFSLAKDGKFQRPDQVMAGCLFWKFNDLDGKGMLWSYTSGKVIP